MRLPALLTTCAFALALAPAGLAQTYYPDDPLWEDSDCLHAPAPGPRVLSNYYDFIENELGRPGEGGPALNVNTLGEVPNSSWYQNRHYRNRMSLEALVRGPGAAGPATGPWEVVGAKTDGKTPGFVIEDTTGARFLLKFDPPDFLGLTTGAEVIGTKLAYALGYHVPENTIVTFERDRLEIEEGTSVEDPYGRKHPITDELVRELLAQTRKTAEGYYRTVASRYVEGRPIGPFEYAGRRPDDANDLWPHERRRELRGLRVAAAWLNHTDARAQNTLDAVVTEVRAPGDTVRYVRHYLLDFGSTLGAGATGIKGYDSGHEGIFSPGPVLTSALTLGIFGRPWLSAAFDFHPAIGRFTADTFDPQRWKPQYRNPAFHFMDADDAFWAARQIAHFTDEEIRAIVGAAAYPDPEAAHIVSEVLIRRRDTIARVYLWHGGGVDRFRVEGGRLVFDDLLVLHALAPPPLRGVHWRAFDNRTGTVGQTIETATLEAGGTSAAIPDTPGDFVVAEFETPGLGVTAVTLRREHGSWVPVGVERRASTVSS